MSCSLPKTLRGAACSEGCFVVIKTVGDLFRIVAVVAVLFLIQPAVALGDQRRAGAPELIHGAIRRVVEAIVRGGRAETGSAAAIFDQMGIGMHASHREQTGGAGKIDDFITLFKTLPKVDAGLAASIFHFGEVKISDLKEQMAKNNIPTRNSGF